MTPSRHKWSRDIILLNIMSSKMFVFLSNLTSLWYVDVQFSVLFSMEKPNVWKNFFTSIILSTNKRLLSNSCCDIKIYICPKYILYNVLTSFIDSTLIRKLRLQIYTYNRVKKFAIKYTV